MKGAAVMVIDIVLHAVLPPAALTPSPSPASVQRDVG